MSASPHQSPAFEALIPLARTFLMCCDEATRAEWTVIYRRDDREHAMSRFSCALQAMVYAAQQDLEVADMLQVLSATLGTVIGVNCANTPSVSAVCLRLVTDRAGETYAALHPTGSPN